MRSLSISHNSAMGEDQDGFTLIEVMLAILIFTVGIMAVSSMTIIAFNAFGKARTDTAEAYQTVKIIDTLRSTKYFNSSIFNAMGLGDSNYPLSPSESNTSRSWDYNNVVVRDVKFIAVEDSQMIGPSASGNYRLYYSKIGVLNIN